MASESGGVSAGIEERGRPRILYRAAKLVNMCQADSPARIAHSLSRPAQILAVTDDARSSLPLCATGPNVRRNEQLGPDTAGLLCVCTSPPATGLYGHMTTWELGCAICFRPDSESSYQSQHHNRFYRPIPCTVVHALPRLNTGATSVLCPMRITSAPTSQSFTSRMITLSRSSIASSLRYASRSPSARRSGTRWMRDQTFSLCSSLDGKTMRQGPILRRRAFSGTPRIRSK